MASYLGTEAEPPSSGWSEALAQHFKDINSKYASSTASFVLLSSLLLLTSLFPIVTRPDKRKSDLEELRNCRFMYVPFRAPHTPTSTPSFSLPHCNFSPRHAIYPFLYSFAANTQFTWTLCSQQVAEQAANIKGENFASFMADVNRYIKDMTKGTSPHAVLGGLLALGAFVSECRRQTTWQLGGKELSYSFASFTLLLP